MQSVWKLLAVLFLGAGLYGLFIPESMYKTSFEYGFYSGPKVSIESGTSRVSMFIEPTGNSEGYVCIYTADGKHTDDRVNATYDMPYQNSNCTLNVHLYGIHTGKPEYMESDFDVRYSVYSVFVLRKGVEDQRIVGLSKGLTEAYQGKETSIDIGVLINEYNLTYPFRVWTETTVDYRVTNENRVNGTRYTVNEYVLDFYEEYIHIEAFSRTPTVSLIGTQEDLSDIRNMGQVMSILGLIFIGVHWVKSKELF